jgi:hypothetical protein
MDPKTNGVQGEGNYDATHHYNDGLKKSVEKGNAEELAKKAEEALDGPEGDELRKAEEIAKQGSKPGATKPGSK